MKRLAFCLLTLLIPCGCFMKNDFSPKKPDSFQINSVTAKELLPAMKELSLYVTIKTANGREILGKNVRLNEGYKFNTFDTNRIKADQQITVAALKEKGGTAVTLRKVNLWQKLKEKEENDYRLYTFKVEDVKMTTSIFAEALYY